MPAYGYTIANDDVKNLAKVLRKVSPQLGREMRKAVRTSAKPVMTEMKDKISGSAMPGQTSTRTGRKRDYHPYDGPTGTGGLSGKIAKAVRLRISSGKVRIYVASNALGSAERIPAYVDFGKPWRHPVLGNRKVWVSQSGSASGWFTDTAREHFPKLRTEVADTLDEFATKVAAML